MSRHHWCEFYIHAFHVMPSMSTIVSAMNLCTYVVGKASSIKADQLAKPGNGTVNAWVVCECSD